MSDKIIEGLKQAVASAHCDHRWENEKVIREDDRVVAVRRYCPLCMVTSTEYLRHD